MVCVPVTSPAYIWGSAVECFVQVVLVLFNRLPAGKNIPYIQATHGCDSRVFKLQGDIKTCARNNVLL